MRIDIETNGTHLWPTDRASSPFSGEEIDSSINVLGLLDFHMQKNEVGRNLPSYTKINSHGSTD